MKVPLPLRIFADFECFNQLNLVADYLKNLFKQIPIAVGLEKNICFGKFCVNWFIKTVLELQSAACECFKTTLDVHFSLDEEKRFEKSTECWFCEQLWECEKVRDQDHPTGELHSKKVKR